MLPELSSKTHLPILIVQHMPPGFTKSLAESLAKKCRHQVVEASEGDVVSNDHIYIAPGGKHMIVTAAGGVKKIALTEGAPENGCRPAVDVMFRSVVEHYGGKVTVVILTGMGSDGTLGAKPLRSAGASVIVQDKASSVVWGMPGSAYEAGVADEVVPLMQVPSAVENTL
jgi:two-component system chemotaxis response regulator CheB